MKLTGGTLIQQSYFLNSDLTTDNPYLPDDIIVIGYDLIGSDRVNNIQKIGPGFWNDLPPMFESGSPGGKVTLNLTGASMSVDYALTLTVLQSWIDDLGSRFAVAQILLNKNTIPITAQWSNYPVTAGDTILITGLDTIANTVTLDIILL